MPTPHAALKRRAALASIGATAALGLAKLGAALASGSLALLSDAAQGLIDLGAALLTYAAVRAADRPADEDHHYGHAKVEALAALAQAALLVLVAGGTAVEAARRLWTGHAPPLDDLALVVGVLVLSMAVDLARWRALRRVARATGSEALAADAAHYASDLASSGLVLLGVLGAARGLPAADALAALGVAAVLLVTGLRLGRRTVDTLLDAAPRGAAEAARAAAERVPGVVGVGRLRVRPSGAGLLVEASVGVPRALPLERAEALRAAAAGAIEAALPGARATVAAEPRALDTETLLERVLLVAAHRRAAVHHVTVQAIGGRPSVSFDLEVDARLPLAEAHALATRLEEAVRAEIGGDAEVESHIEPLEPEELAGEDAGAVATARVAAALRAAAGPAGVADVHQVRARATPGGLVVNYHCRLDGALDVAVAHARVDALDRAARAALPEVARLVGHAEPLGWAHPPRGG